MAEKELNLSLKVDSAQVDKLVEFLQRSGKPQTTEALVKRFIENLREAAGIKK
jgi:hypothetical protein